MKQSPIILHIPGNGSPFGRANLSCAHTPTPCETPYSKRIARPCDESLYMTLAHLRVP